METKQTAVEWLMANLTSLFVDDSGHYKKLFEQAKAMEKEQIISAFADGSINGFGCGYDMGKYGEKTNYQYPEAYFQNKYGIE